jgi:hypothetical protein
MISKKQQTHLLEHVKRENQNMPVIPMGFVSNVPPERSASHPM